MLHSNTRPGMDICETTLRSCPPSFRTRRVRISHGRSMSLLRHVNFLRIFETKHGVASGSTDYSLCGLDLGFARAENRTACATGSPQNSCEKRTLATELCPEPVRPGSYPVTVEQVSPIRTERLRRLA